MLSYFTSTDLVLDTVSITSFRQRSALSTCHGVSNTPAQTDRLPHSTQSVRLQPPKQTTAFRQHTVYRSTPPQHRLLLFFAGGSFKNREETNMRTARVPRHYRPFRVAGGGGRFLQERPTFCSRCLASLRKLWLHTR